MVYCNTAYVLIGRMILLVNWKANGDSQTHDDFSVVRASVPYHLRHMSLMWKEPNAGPVASQNF